MKKGYKILTALLVALGITGCTEREHIVADEGGMTKLTYTTISQDEAKVMMESEEDYVIVDVRRADEFAEGHIPGAINIPNESIGKDKPEELSDTDQVILVYCRSGRRSAEASQKLADLGYTKVYNFGGILDWDGAVVTE